MMTAKTTARMNMLPVMGSSFFSFTKARFFAGLFGVPKIQICPIRQ